MPTFYIKTDYPSFENEMVKRLITRGWKQSSKMPVDFIFLSGNASFYKQKFDTKRSEMVSLLWGKSFDHLTNKAALNQIFKGESFIPDADTIQQGEELPELPNRFLKILKPVKGFYGSGIQVVSNKKQVTDWLSEHSKYDEWTLQDYIRNPALIDGYKFHIRMHAIVFNKPYEVYLQNTGEYSYAKEQYVKGDWTNPDIHDTHVYVKDDEEREFFPTVLPDDWTPRIGTRAMNGIRNAVHTIFTKERDFKPDWNAKNGFYMFGVDVMFDKTNPIVIEVNKNAGLDGTNYIIEPLLSIVIDQKEHPLFTRII
jgi:hypothetical protein